MATANVVPVTAKINFDPDSYSFRLRASTQVTRPDGTRYEVEIENSVDLGVLINLLLNLWSGGRYLAADQAITAMASPSTTIILPAVTFSGSIPIGSPHDVGDADPRNNADDTTAT